MWYDGDSEKLTEKKSWDTYPNEYYNDLKKKSQQFFIEHHANLNHINTNSCNLNGSLRFILIR